MRLPIAISLPHAGRACPPQLAWFNQLSEQDLHFDHDFAATELFGLADQVAFWAATPIARAYIDVDRAPDDFGPDGVVKSHTQWDRAVYRQVPPPELIAHLLERYHLQYHVQLSAAAAHAQVGIDCRAQMEWAAGERYGGSPTTQAGVRIGVVPGVCPAAWIHALQAELVRTMPGPVHAFRLSPRSYSVQAHAHEMPWLRLEIAPMQGQLQDQRAALFRALSAWCDRSDGPVRLRARYDGPDQATSAMTVPKHDANWA